MWLLPPDFPRRPLRLAPDCRALPWHATREEIEQLMELLRRMVPEIREWVWVPWPALGRVGANREVRDGAAIVTEMPEGLSEDEARAAVEQVRWPYVFWRPIEPYERDVDWTEREVKRALLSELRQGLESEEHPLHAQGIGVLPVELAAEATDDPVELLAIVQGAVEHRLRRAEDGLHARDWEYSVRRAIGERLAARLGRVPREALTGVLELVLSEGKRPAEGKARVEAGRSLQAAGLGLWVGESVALGPLARQASDPTVYGVLLDRQPIEYWPADARGHRFIRVMQEDDREFNLPRTRIAGPAFFPHEEWLRVVLIQIYGLVDDHPSRTGKMVKAILEILSDLVWDTVTVSKQRTELGRRLGRLVLRIEKVGLSPGNELERSIVQLSRIVMVVIDRQLDDLWVMLRRVELRLSLALEEVDSSGLTALISMALLPFCSTSEQIASMARLATEHVARTSESSARIWHELILRARRLSGDAAGAIRKCGLRPSSRWSENMALASAYREAGYETFALWYLQGASRVRKSNGINESVFSAEQALEFGHIETSRGSIEKAIEHYRNSRAVFTNLGYEGMALYAEVFELSACQPHKADLGAEHRLREIKRVAVDSDERRLSVLADLVLGDLATRTSRFDMATECYDQAIADANVLGDELAQASALEKLASVASRTGDDERCLERTLEAAELEARNERHSSAARLFASASTLAEQLGQDQDAHSYRQDERQQRVLDESHEIEPKGR